MTILFTNREIMDIMEFRLGGLYLQEMRDLRGGGATLAEVFFFWQLWLRWEKSDRDDYEQILGGRVLPEERCGDEATGEKEGATGGTS